MAGYPNKSWYEVKDHEGTVIWHQRRCGRFRVQLSLSGEYICSHLPDGFREVQIGTKAGLSAAMAFCREYLDKHGEVA